MARRGWRNIGSWTVGSRSVGAVANSPRPTPRSQDRHLCLAFFDILHLDGESLIDRTYEFRRRLLRKVVRPLHVFVSTTLMCTSDNSP